MKCPKCQFENPEGIKFCGECGGKFEIRCSKCNASNPPQFKFCGECGHVLAQTAKPSPINYDQPQSYTPKHLADKILTTRTSIEGERKVVTVLFADVANFTSISEKLDPEDVHQIMDGCFKILMDEIHRFEGTINQFTGDGVMALFGAPIAHEDHAQRACHASLTIQSAIKPYAEKLKTDLGIDFSMRIGINSGPVVVGSIGDDLRMDYTAQGDTSNLASRMESHAEPGTVLISENTYRLVRSFFELASKGKLQVKGKEAPVEAYQLVKPGEIETRIGASAAKGLTRFVGRNRELERVKEAFRKARSGQGQVVGIVGEAGVGKSRLLLELRNVLPKGEYTYLEGHCLHYGGFMPYLPILDVFRSYIGIKEGERESVIKEKMNERILGLDENLSTIIPPFQELLSLKPDDEKYAKLEPKQKREKTFESIRDLLIRGSQERPLILAIEDLHWIDKTSEEFLEYMIGSLPNNHILLILLYRPEYTHAWGSKSYYSKIGVDQLSSDTSSELVRAILDGGDVMPELRNLILGRASGNPFFMEELTHSLLEKGAILKKEDQYVLSTKPSDIQVPDTIQGIIAARMDQLEEGLKRIMQVASVIGREFAFRILHAITEMKDDLKSNLVNLQGLEFIYEKSLFPELEYIFRHALTQEVAYNSLLVKRRKEIHEKIAQAIEELYTEQLEEFYEMLAYHYSNSENYEKSTEYSKLAGKKARKSGSMDDAIFYAKQRIASIERLPKTDQVQIRIINARSTLGQHYAQMNYFNEAKEAIEPITDLAEKMGYKARLPQIYTVLGNHAFYVEEDWQAGTEYFNNAIRIAEEISDVASLSVANYWMGVGMALTCEFEKAIYCLNKAMEINVRAKNLWGEAIIKSVISCLVYYYQGKIILAYKTSKEAVQLSEESTIAKSVTYGFHGFCCYGKGLFEEAIPYLIEGVKICEKGKFFSYHAWTESCLGDIYFEYGKYEKAKKHYEKGLLSWDMCRSYPSNRKTTGLSLERAKIMNNEKDVDLESLYRYFDGEIPKLLEGWMQRDMGEILLRIDDKHYSEAEEYINKAIQSHKRHGLMFHLGRDYALYAELFKRKGDQPKVRENLGKAIEILRECGADGWVAKYEKELTSVS